MTAPRTQANPDWDPDLMIQRKVAAAQGEVFRQRFPGQVEHCQRLIAERLQQGLRKDAESQLTTQEILDLSSALRHMGDMAQVLAAGRFL